ncbi:MAG TPA: hypothetical protein VHM19_08150, partial [Polyangiales bacterium]|nr:hypothetical protein [Polyangiales bacterium]
KNSWMRLALLLLGSTVVVGLAGCKSDHDSAKDAGPAGEKCLAPGLTENDCSCPGGLRGNRTCMQNMVWGLCECPEPLPDGQFCREGQLLTCPICKGATESKITRCMAGGLYDCTCPGADGGMPPKKKDAGGGSQDDASSGGDAG